MITAICLLIMMLSFVIQYEYAVSIFVSVSVYDCHYIRVSASGHGIRSLNRATTVKAMCIDTTLCILFRCL